MTSVIDYLAIIPARGGSKRLPGKNIRPLNGKPLIAWSIESAKNSQKLSHVIVSTDDIDIADCAKKYGADVPFLRPLDISDDTSSVVDVLRHAVVFYEEQAIDVRNIVLLQVTSPFRGSHHIDKAISVFEEHKPDSLTSVSPARNHPYYALKGEVDNMEPFFDIEKLSMKTCELPKAAYENGAVFIMSRDILMNSGIYGKKNVVIDFNEPDLMIDIDTAQDFAFAEFLLQRKGQKS